MQVRKFKNVRKTPRRRGNSTAGRDFYCSLEIIAVECEEKDYENEHPSAAVVAVVVTHNETSLHRRGIHLAASFIYSV